MRNTIRCSNLLRNYSLVCLATSIFMIQAHAASLQVAPILLEFSPQEKVKELWLTNTGSDEIRGQVRVNYWTQNNNQDVITPTKDLIASPMVLTIPAGQRQLVRLIRSANSNLSSEQAYRLIVDELPNPKTEEKSGLQLLLKYSIPVFFKTSHINAVDQGLTSLKGMTFKYTDHQLLVINQTTSYKRFSQFAYVDSQGKKTPIQMGLMGYVLNGQSMQWPIPKQLNIQPTGKFVAVVNMDVREQILQLAH